ncbi:MAG: nucleotidyl transferase AbiEii/AbiGii toxin family protein [Candidatus Hinthialibacter antarcticus]|nr:nucleotidyl transferase AbiEii/AbiGii toxin family protein [Candidatus Hinthialibacter antarcticus]
MKQLYKEQVELLLAVLPEVAKEDCFALHGGTAINLFIRDMPRLSVDIDLTFVPFEDRESSLNQITIGLERITQNVSKVISDAHVQQKPDVGKLLISRKHSTIKIEINLVNRGVLANSEQRILCPEAQEQFNAYCVIPVVPFGQLFGSKICAALDRQHPRDLFDVRYLLNNEGFSDEVKTGFLLTLLSSNRPFHEILNPNLIDQRKTMSTQFEGMSEELFSYEEFGETRDSLINTIHQSLSDQDKAFLLSVLNLEPAWEIYDFERFPAVQWKLQNLRTLKESNRTKYDEQFKTLEILFNSP